MNKPVLIFLLALILCSACTGDRKMTGQSSETDVLTGQINRAELFETRPDWMQEYISYTPAANLLDSIRTASADTDVEIFLGTWCSDSRREVSRFFKIRDLCGEDTFTKITLWALDRDKRLPDNTIVESRDIWFVATIIFYRDGKELGRIVEFPAKSLEADMLKILKIKS